MKNITFGYNKKIVIRNVNLSIHNGSHIAVVGESGCGKSTLLKLIYGLYDLDSGEIIYNQTPVLGPKFNLIPGAAQMKYLAQDFDLMPFITVEENVGKFLSNIYKDKKQARVDELLRMVEMTDFAQVKVQHLSGGQQQRVALARVLALEPEVLLLDEPFSQIDVFRRNKLRRNLFNYLKEKQITCIVATHDSGDVLAFADEMLVMKNGEIIRQGNPRTVYENPGELYVASIFGEVNELPKSLFDETGNASEMVFIYPHQLKIVTESKLLVKVVKSYFKGNSYLVESVFEGKTVFFESAILLTENSQFSLGLK